jgi:hypothetical protein
LQLCSANVLSFHIAILAAFAVANMNSMLSCIDIINLELESFIGSQAQAIDNKQEDAEP